MPYHENPKVMKHDLDFVYPVFWGDVLPRFMIRSQFDRFQ
jgi:hypothetical protein